MNAARQLKPFRGARLNRTHPLARGLVGCWIFNEGSGDKVYDLSGYGNHGTLTNMDPPTDWVGGKHGWALDFDGSNDDVQIPYSNVLNPPKFTMATSVRVDSGDGQYRTPIGSRHGWNYTGYCLLTNKFVNNKWQVMIGNGTGWPTVTGSIAVLGKWIHLVGTYDGFVLRLYEDGVAVGVPNTCAFVPNTSVGFSIGSLPADLWFPGLISEVYIYNRALSVEEVAWVYREPFCMFEEPTPRSIFIMPELEAPLDLVNVAATLHAIEYNVELSIY